MFDRRKVLTSILMGILSFITAKLSVSYIFGDISITIVWFMIFPMIIALAYGHRYALIASTIGLSAFAPFYLWPENGYANIVTLIMFIFLYSGIGWIAEQRRQKPAFWNRPYIGSIPLIIVMSLFLYIFYPITMRMNPPFWAPFATSDLPEHIAMYIAVKNIPNTLLCLLVAEVLVRMPFVKKVLGLPHSYTQRLNTAIVSWTIILSAIGWFTFVIMNSIFIHNMTELLRMNFYPYEFLAGLVWIMMAATTASILMDYFEFRLEVEHRLNETTKSLEELNHFLDDKVTEQTIQLKETITKLARAEKIVSLNTLVTSIAHEINTPLGNTITTVSYMKMSLESVQSEYKPHEEMNPNCATVFEDMNISIEMIQSNLNRINNLVQSFKRLSTIQHYHVISDFDIRECLESAFEVIQNSNINQKADITITCPMPLQVRMDFSEVFQVFSTLIENSFVHAFKEGESGHIHVQIHFETSDLNDTTIATATRGNHLVIEYSDSGENLADGLLEHIFDPFFSTNRNNGATGLGLSILYNTIVQHLGGEINASLSENRGIGFIIKLPTMST